MRIVNEYNLPHLKATLFVMQEKYSIKLEDQYGALIYKLGALDAHQLGQIEAILHTPSLKSHLADGFVKMRTGRDHLLKQLSPDQNYDHVII